jgi:hypothetical protein
MERTMRRRPIALEWGLVLAMVGALGFLGIWGSSYFIDDTLFYQRTPYPPDKRYVVHFSLGNGTICLFDHAVIGDAGNLGPFVVDARTHIPPPPIRRVGRVAIPGLGFDSCEFAPDGYTVWSIRLSLLYPITALLLVAVVLGWRVKRRSRGIKAEGSSIAAR